MKDFTEEFLRGFEGMTAQPVTREELAQARAALIEEIVGRMPEAHRRFLILFEQGEPDWTLVGVPGAADLPAVAGDNRTSTSWPPENGPHW